MTKEEYMDIALSIAEATIGQTSPNPSVGAVLVKDNQIIGMGTHLRAGHEHAEVLAIKQAGPSAVGADMYVTLEPCSHFGRTPPCVDLIIEHNIRKVYVACLDPNPEVAGKGIEKLKQSGIEVEVGVQETRAQELNRKFFHFIQTKRPYVTLKSAMTLDGKTATANGDSKWITSSDARLDVHRQRDVHDAILVGVNTVLQDNPQLTTRLPQGGKNPIRIILDTKLRIAKNSKVLLNHEAPTWIICGRNADVDSFKTHYPHVKVFSLDTKQVELETVLNLLGEQRIQSLYVEGGSTIHGQFVAQRLFNECHWYIAPKLLGGSDAFPSVGGNSPEWMKDAIDLDVVKVEQLGSDIKITARSKEAK
ncbi:bifunctional diaminohydroxyphosphoribosylaminopyrimidine deaminase/5-amino-6-(5-phosphoribosylamino)uracil reductase RibD [Radiobacillus kanasensis]|uniref:bifunctional diaminohydroxyphosphoribosylaminopyrimidine deaminase/5-amino-6-(5-phosphoribosylamino)uracil reductase RibD n=1 Tax=Radiobacillus kanasensis TaxID=2844358 RepID=UPI001E56A3F2|nr:bifunctional diaminohydroxyphosphoribosylaminopyrimidine deaminase/5-amino-6-(5-phosphoribosylamino)uracil reductase RibD [Radiobacillus kanasensis]UFU00304.1 bifunctional diaminohydroxyphosphoribosylaminopyrimidine deaminase/5-amino-6-(5-phosphoribosylamino)uracil reductase RibD [Radiobacillus kanasensis]